MLLTEGVRSRKEREDSLLCIKVWFSNYLSTWEEPGSHSLHGGNSCSKSYIDKSINFHCSQPTPLCTQCLLLSTQVLLYNYNIHLILYPKTKVLHKICDDCAFFSFLFATLGKSQRWEKHFGQTKEKAHFLVFLMNRQNDSDYKRSKQQYPNRQDCQLLWTGRL